MEPAEAQELIEEAAKSADKLIGQSQRDGVGLPEEGQKAVEAVIAAARCVKSGLLVDEQRRSS